MSDTLGRLTKVPIREIWNDEASDFTPWLAVVNTTPSNCPMKPLANTESVIICPLQATNPLATTVPNINLSSLSNYQT